MHAHMHSIRLISVHSRFEKGESYLILNPKLTGLPLGCTLPQKLSFAPLRLIRCGAGILVWIPEMDHLELLLEGKGGNSAK